MQTADDDGDDDVANADAVDAYDVAADYYVAVADDETDKMLMSQDRDVHIYCTLLEAPYNSAGFCIIHIHCKETSAAVPTKYNTICTYNAIHAQYKTKDIIVALIHHFCIKHHFAIVNPQNDFPDKTILVSVVYKIYNINA